MLNAANKLNWWLCIILWILCIGTHIDTFEVNSVSPLFHRVIRMLSTIAHQQSIPIFRLEFLQFRWYRVTLPIYDGPQQGCLLSNWLMQVKHTEEMWNNLYEIKTMYTSCCWSRLTWILCWSKGKTLLDWQGTGPHAIIKYVKWDDWSLICNLVLDEEQQQQARLKMQLLLVCKNYC